MDELVETFLANVLALEGEHSNLVRDGVRVILAKYETRAIYAFDVLCRVRVVEEMQRRKGTLTAVHLKIVLGVIDGPARFPLKVK